MPSSIALMPKREIAAAIAHMSLTNLENELRRQLALLSDGKGGGGRRVEFEDTRSG